MEFTKYVRKPFMIEAIQITEENMQEVCDMIGFEIRHKDGQPYIVVNKKIVPNGYRAYVGQWVTRMGNNIRCYPKRVFDDQFIDYGPEWSSWFEDESEDTPDVKDAFLDKLNVAIQAEEAEEAVIVYGAEDVEEANQVLDAVHERIAVVDDGPDPRPIA